MKKIKINEIFISVDGEVNSLGGQGIWSTFIRFQGCNLRCSYCDTKRAWNEDRGEFLSVNEIVDRSSACNKFTITGGEPLLQFDGLMELLSHLDGSVSLETNGSLDISGIDEKVNVIMDYKLPSSGQEDRMRVENFSLLKPDDYVKFVIKDADDYSRAKLVLKKYWNVGRIAFSPCFPEVSPKQLFDWMYFDSLFHVQLNIQIHKLVGVE